MKSATAVAMALTFIGVVAFGIFLVAHHWFPPVLSVHGAGVQRMLMFTLTATGIFFLVGHLLLIYILLRFGVKPLPIVKSIGVRWEKRLIWIPMILFAVVAEGGAVVLGLPVWKKVYGEPPPDALQVEVTGRQFFWAIRYPGADGKFGAVRADRVGADNEIGVDIKDPAAQDDILVLNELVVPVNRPVRMYLRSLDVIHSFFLPQLRLKQDVVPGMRIPVWFTATQTGKYELACNQICGLGHYRMRGFLRVVTAAEFDDWLANQWTVADFFAE